ncbi:MAG: DUF748 domain-containing protein [Burkholderiales bacterium]|nr:DUF748 domain-containing protein [Burkholderiales bacterium]
MSKTADRLARLRVLLLTRPAKIIGVLLVIYAICGFLLAPWLLRQQFPGLVEKNLNAQGSVGSVYINPFLMIFDARDLVIAEKNGAPVLQAGRVLINFELSSLLRWAWTFSEIRIEQPVLNADLDAKESLNLARLLTPKTAEPASPPEKSASLPRLLLQHVAITGGSFRFTDHTLQPTARAQISPFNFEIHDISTLPNHSGEHALTARLPGGGSLQWQGKLGLSPLDSSGSLTLKEAKLATLWQFVQDHLTIAEPVGTYEVALRYRLRYAKGALDAQVDDLALRMKDLKIAQRNDGAVLVQLATIAFEGGAFNLAQRSLAFKDIRIADGALNVTLDENGVADWAKLVLSRPADGDATVKNTAKEATAPPTAPWQIALPQISVGPLAISVTDFSRIKPLRLATGNTRINLGVAAAIGEQTQVTVSDGIMTMNDISVMSGDEKEPPVTLVTAEVSGVNFDLQKKRINAGLLRLSGGHTRAMRESDGSLHLVKLFTPRQEKPPQEAGFNISVDRAEIAGYTVALIDKTFEPALGYDLEQINGSIAKIMLPPTKTPSPFELALRVKQGGSVQVKGALDLLRESTDARLEVLDLALAPLNTLLRRDTTLALTSGKAGVAGRVTINSKNKPLAVQYRGSAGITDLDLKIENSTERLLSWQKLQVADIDLDTGKNQLSVGQVSLAKPYSKLVINKDRSTNFGAIMRPRPAAAAPSATTDQAAAPMAVTVERVSVERGELDFADLSLVLPFATNIKSLGGSASGLSSAPESRASLKFEGRVEDSGLARAEGTIQPFAPKKFTDIAVEFRNVALSPLSPYTATFAGRKIASGRLSLDLQYKINNSQLAGENKVLLEQFTLGERVESPTAVNLPLDLAIALLTDSDGKIDLAVPVSGNVDNPEFSYGGVIWQAIRTVITRIVTAPFRALGSLFGANSETLGDIVFDPGSARILPTEYEKIRRVAEGLQKRAQLRLVVQGSYHVQSDSLGLRTIAVRADLANREGLKLAPGEDPGPIGFDSAKVQRALENMLNERAGGDAAAQFAAAFQKTAGREAGRVNAALALLGRGAGDRELYIAMHQKLLELQPLPPTALEDLARARAAAITNAFTNRLKFDPARLAGKPPVATEETTKSGVVMKLSFEPIK